MENFINKAVDKQGVEANLQDARIVTPEEATGKFLKDDFTWADAGGELPEIINLTSIDTPKWQDLFNAVGWTSSTPINDLYCTIKCSKRGTTYTYTGHLSIEYRGAAFVTFNGELVGDTLVMFKNMTSSSASLIDDLNAQTKCLIPLAPSGSVSDKYYLISEGTHKMSWKTENLAKIQEFTSNDPDNDLILDKISIDHYTSILFAINVSGSPESFYGRIELYGSLDHFSGIYMSTDNIKFAQGKSVNSNTTIREFLALFDTTIGA